MHRWVGLEPHPLPAPVVDLIGNAGAILTTVCWLPQAIKIIRDREIRALSLPTNLAFTLGMVLWLLYGMALPDWPLIWSSSITVALMLVIVALKIRYGLSRRAKPLRSACGRGAQHLPDQQAPAASTPGTRWR